MENCLRIAYLNTRYQTQNSSGGATHIKEFIEHMVEKGHVIFAYKSNQHPKIIPIPTRKFKRIINLLKWDVIYIRYDGNLNPTIQISKSPYRIFYKHSLIVWEFNTIPSYLFSKNKTEKDYLHQIDCLRDEAKISDLAICVTEEMSDFVTETLGFNNTVTIPNGANPEHFHPSLPTVSSLKYYKEKINIVWIGSIDYPYNDTDLLLATSKEFWSSGIDKTHFHIIGPYQQELAQIITPNVTLHGPQSYELLPNWLSGMDIGLLLYKPSQSDYGSPIKLFDYMASGLAVISTPHPQVSRILNEIGAGDYVLNGNDPQELSSKIRFLIDNPDQLDKLQSSARIIIKNKYNWETNTNAVLSSISTYMQKRHKGRLIG